MNGGCYMIPLEWLVISNEEICCLKDGNESNCLIERGNEFQQSNCMKKNVDWRYWLKLDDFWRKVAGFRDEDGGMKCVQDR